MLREEKHRDRLPDDLAAPDDDRLLPFELDLVLGQESHDPERGRRHEHRLAEEQPARVQRVEPVHVLRRVDRERDLRLVHVLGQRQLHEDPVDAVVRVQLVEQVQHLALGRRRGKAVIPRLDPGLGARVVLLRHVDVRRGIVPDEHRREADGAPERVDLAGDLAAELLGEHFPVHANRGHGAEAYCGDGAARLRYALLFRS